MIPKAAKKPLPRGQARSELSVEGHEAGGGADQGIPWGEMSWDMLGFPWLFPSKHVEKWWENMGGK